VTILYGLCTSPATFERSMENALRGSIYNSFLVYLNDVTVIGRNFKEHLFNLRKVFRRYQKVRLKLNPEKLQLLQKTYGTAGL
jgi:hypothetical protein